MQAQLKRVLLNSNNLQYNSVLSQKQCLWIKEGIFAFWPYVNIQLPLYLSKGFTAVLELVPRASAFCLFWTSHLNLKLAAEEAVSSCTSFTFSVQLSSTDFSPVSRESPLLDRRAAVPWVLACAEAVHRKILWSSLLHSLNLIQVCCSPFWVKELKCTECAGLPWRPHTANLQSCSTKEKPGLPDTANPQSCSTRKKPGFLRKILQCCH